MRKRKEIVKYPYDKVRVKQIIDELPIDKHKYVITVAKYVQKRTVPMNSWFWAWISMLEEYTGMSRNQLHDDICDMFGPTYSYINLNNETVVKHKTTSMLDAVEFSEFMDKIHIFFMEDFDPDNPINLPYPDDSNFNDFILEFADD